jgi:hypothetical protein
MAGIFFIFLVVYMMNRRRCTHSLKAPPTATADFCKSYIAERLAAAEEPAATATAPSVGRRTKGPRSGAGRG